MTSPETIAVIDYGSGNLRSVQKALEKVAAGSGRAVVVTADPAQVAAASHIVLPGVGAFADCMRGLQSLPGMVETLTETVQRQRVPFLGICVGMQLLADRGHEHGTYAGLGWIPGEVRRLTPADAGLKIPHMGWNDLHSNDMHRPASDSPPLTAALPDGAHAYFVHSYQYDCADPADVALQVDYGGPLTAAIARGHIVGTQFHPEKSQDTGLLILRNFLERYRRP